MPLKPYDTRSASQRGSYRAALRIAWSAALRPCGQRSQSSSRNMMWCAAGRTCGGVNHKRHGGVNGSVTT
eukprot:5335505-Prymnesium_polylepis.1